MTMFEDLTVESPRWERALAWCIFAAPVLAVIVLATSAGVHYCFRSGMYCPWTSVEEQLKCEVKARGLVLLEEREHAFGTEGLPVLQQEGVSTKELVIAGRQKTARLYLTETDRYQNAAVAIDDRRESRNSLRSDLSMRYLTSALDEVR